MKKILPDDVFDYTYDVRGNLATIANQVTEVEFDYRHFDEGTFTCRTTF